VAPLKP